VPEPIQRPSAASSRAPQPWETVRLAAFLGLAGGTTQSVLLLGRRLIEGRLLLINPHSLWLAPYLASLVALAAAVAALVVVRRRPDRDIYVLGAGAFVAWIGLVLMIGALHAPAALTLTAGLAVLTVRVVRGASRRKLVFAMRFTATISLFVSVLGVATATGVSLTHGALTSPTTRGQMPARAPNILLLILDTVRATELTLYGYQRPTSPQIDKWAARGTVFDLAISSAPWTLPSHASMFTGREAAALGTSYFTGLADSFPLIAEFLAGEGYQTGAFVGNVEYVSRETGLDRGFQQYRDYRLTISAIARGSALARRLSQYRWIRRILWEDDIPGRKRARDVNDELLEWLAGNDPSRPFFAFVNYYDAHAPYRPASEAAAKFGAEPSRHDWLPIGTTWDTDNVERVRASYDAAISELDAAIGTLLERLDHDGRLKNTVVIITSDHGEEFHEHGVMGHGNSLYVAGVHVPLILIYPGHIPAGQRQAEPVATRRLAATMAELATGAPQAVFPGPSLSLAWQLHESSGETPNPIFSSVEKAPGLPGSYPISSGNLSSVVLGHMRAIFSTAGPAQLYDLAQDWPERHNLADIAAMAPLIDSMTSMSRRLEAGESPR